ncbi:hypothetical protein ACV07N_09215 [Roseivirga echinicomitans]
MERVLIISHVAAGVTTLLSGILAAFFGKRGGSVHRAAGKVFFWSMAWIFISAILIVTFVRFNFFLTIIAVFSFYMTFAGQRVLKIKKTLKPLPIDWIAAFIAIVFGLTLFVAGIRFLILSDFSSSLGYLSIVFGFFTANTAWLNIKGFRKAKPDKMWWWFAHMNLMSGAFIASLTAFLVQNGALFQALGNMGWILWVLPAAIGSPLIAYHANRYRKQFGVGKYAKAEKI